MVFDDRSALSALRELRQPPSVCLSCCRAMASLAKEVRALVRAAEKQGFTVKEKKNGWMLHSPNGQGSVMIHKTPSDHRALSNARTRLRRYGFQDR